MRVTILNQKLNPHADIKRAYSDFQQNVVHNINILGLTNNNPL